MADPVLAVAGRLRTTFAKIAGGQESDPVVRKGDRVDVGRTDAATKERATIEAYLPAPMSDEDVQKDVAEEVANAAAAGARGGKTMSSEVKAVRERVGASADSGKIAALG